MLSSSYTMIMAGFSLGLIHALDADHVMAVSALSSRKPGMLSTIRRGAHWALGPAGVLLACGLLLFGLGLQVPSSFQQFAEASVGVVLLVIGFLCLWQFRRQKLHLRQHSHGNLVHSHWCLEDESHKKQAQHGPVLIGMLHGLAGSAPALALVPLVIQGQLITGVLYLLMFSFGVMLSMVLFASCLTAMQKKLQTINVKFYQTSRYLVAFGSIVLGGFWLSQSL